MSQPGAASPDESLQMLRASGTVQRLGQAKVGQVQVTRYRVTQSAAEIAEALRSQGKDELAEALERASSEIVGPVRSEVSIDREGVVRRMRSVSTAVSDGKQVTTEMRMNFSDFGIEPDILIPDDSRVLDITPQLEAGLDSLGQAS
jgi:poly-gamma-glutamate capsule biosynthesis protein CapA/YwtB (metallophosphatase superfamily)